MSQAAIDPNIVLVCVTILTAVIVYRYGGAEKKRLRGEVSLGFVDISDLFNLWINDFIILFTISCVSLFYLS